MEKEFFKKVLADTIKEVEHTLGVKALEYVRNDDFMHNFNIGADMTSNTREEVLAGFRLKHEISALDIRNDIPKGVLPTKEKVNEKYNDIINYWILEKASVLHRIDGDLKDDWYKKQLLSEHPYYFKEINPEPPYSVKLTIEDKTNTYCKAFKKCERQCSTCQFVEESRSDDGINLLQNLANICGGKFEDEAMALETIEELLKRRK